MTIDGISYEVVCYWKKDGYTYFLLISDEGEYREGYYPFLIQLRTEDL